MALRVLTSYVTPATPLTRFVPSDSKVSGTMLSVRLEDGSRMWRIAVDEVSEASTLLEFVSVASMQTLQVLPLQLLLHPVGRLGS